MSGLARFILATIALTAPCYAAPIKVFVMAGQSNMVGSGGESTLPEALRSPQDDVLFNWQIRTNETRFSDGFEALRPLTGIGGTFGSEITFGRALADALTEDVAIVKVAYVGRGLERWWVPWRNELFQVMTSHTDAALADLVSQGYTPEVAGFAWVQSQADANWEYAANRYEQNLESMVGAFRDHYNDPDLIFMQNQHHASARAPYGELVRQAKIAFTENDPHSYLVNIDDQFIQSDKIHLGGAA